MRGRLRSCDRLVLHMMLAMRISGKQVERIGIGRHATLDASWR